MRNENVRFWSEAAKSLPSHVRTRYAGYFEQAVAWERAFDNAASLVSRVKTAFARRDRTQAA